MVLVGLSSQPDCLLWYSLLSSYSGVINVIFYQCNVTTGFNVDSRSKCGVLQPALHSITKAIIHCSAPGVLEVFVCR